MFASQIFAIALLVVAAFAMLAEAHQQQYYQYSGQSQLYQGQAGVGSPYAPVVADPYAVPYAASPVAPSLAYGPAGYGGSAYGASNYQVGATYGNAGYGTGSSGVYGTYGAGF